MVVGAIVTVILFAGSLTCLALWTMTYIPDGVTRQKRKATREADRVLRDAKQQMAKVATGKKAAIRKIEKVRKEPVGWKAW